MKTFGKVYALIIFAILYAPILFIVIFSFSAGDSVSNLTFDYSGEGTYFGYWYKELFNDSRSLESMKNSLVVALVSSLVATFMGTFAAIGINKLRNRYVKSTLMNVTNIPMMNPDIVTGVSMMLLFVAFIAVFNGMSAGFGTLLLSHITFNIPYVILSVLPKLRQMDKHLPEAAMDLGCTPLGAFFRVELPFILPGIISALIMAFTLSIDDYVISLFTGGDFQTLPLKIYADTRKGVPPSIYSLSTLFLFVVLVLLITSNIVSAKLEAKRDPHYKASGKGAARNMINNL